MSPAFQPLDGLRTHLVSRKPTLKSHLWAIGKLMSYTPAAAAKDPQEFHKRLLLYIIAACYQKIYRRLIHSTISQPYVDSLKAIDKTTIRHDLCNLRGFELPESPAIAEAESESDEAFIKSLRTALKPKDPHTQEPMVGPEVKILHIKRFVHNPSGRKPNEMYTAKTCIEVHVLLCAILDKFRSSLKALSDLDKRPAFDRVPNEPFAKKLGDILLSIMSYGSLLLHLVHGGIMRQHLQVIEAKLHSQNRHARCKSASATTSSADDGDDDLRAVGPSAASLDGVPRPFWKASRDWLRLTVSHFLSSGVLSQYAISNFISRPIDISVVVSPQTPALDKQSLPWRELFDGSTAFPDTSAGPTLRSNAQLLQFLTTGLARAPAKLDEGGLLPLKLDKVALQTHQLGKLCRSLATIALANWQRSDPTSADADAELQDDGGLQNNDYGWGATSQLILELLFVDRVISEEELVTISATTEYRFSEKAKKNIRDINVLLRQLEDSTAFFRNLDNLDNNFSGVLHCEACLAGLAAPTTAQYANNETVSKLVVSGYMSFYYT